jgi:hypothetical protein
MVEDDVSAKDVQQEPSEPVEQAAQRVRSEIEFPYSDLETAVALARSLHSNAVSPCEDGELAAWMNMSESGGTYRARRSAARMFGLVDAASPGRLSLTTLGRRIVDDDRAARVEAFLKPALFAALYEQYRGQTLPPPPTIERHIERLGVPPKQKVRARQVFQGSAHYAGFVDASSGRFRKPGIGPTPEVASSKEATKGRDGGGGDDGTPPRHPLIEGMFQSLPANGQPWTLDEAADWLHAAAYNLRFAYKLKGKITIDIKIEKPSEMP